MTGCAYCKKSIQKAPLYRTEPKGADNPKWMCMDCIEEHHPELAANIQEEENDFNLNQIFYPKQGKNTFHKNKKR